MEIGSVAWYVLMLVLGLTVGMVIGWLRRRSRNE